MNSAIGISVYITGRGNIECCTLWIIVGMVGTYQALKDFFDVISTCCRARLVGLEWWMGEIKRGQSEFERGFMEYDSDDTTPSEDENG